MPRQNVPAEFTTFIRGLFTEASPLTFPDNASLSEINMNLLRDGSRRRRLGFDYEDNHVDVEISGLNLNTDDSDAYTTFRWENAGGDPNRSLLVVQIAHHIRVFDIESTPISNNLVHSDTLPESTRATPYSYAVVDGILVIAAGLRDITIFQFDEDTSTVTRTTDNLLIRDLFGVEAIVDGDDLNSTSNIEIRPESITPEHLYNLRNQTFAVPRFRANEEVLGDPVQYFFDESDNVNPTPPEQIYPSNADNLTSVLYADANDTDNRTVERFFPRDLIANPLGSARAPFGYFIIDALDRGISRMSEEVRLRERYPALELSVSSLPQDKTPGGASIVTQFAGRVWYAGFSGEVIEGDSRSPRMSSYVLFSRLVQDSSDIGKCFQVGDPTSREDPDLLDTDGGFVRIDEAYGIHSMTSLGREMIITAPNGVWQITGGDRNGFTATNYAVDKLSEHGSISPTSVVQINNDLAFWGEDGIYLVTKNQFGDRVVENITQQTIQTFYDNISFDSKTKVRGFYDSFERKLRWVYNTNVLQPGNTRELIFDINLSAFYVHEIGNVAATALPRVVSVFETNPFITQAGTDPVTVNDDPVTVNGEAVTVTQSSRVDSQRELNYLIISSTNPVSFSFGFYKNDSFADWESVDGTGVDAEAELITGYLSGGDFQRTKDVVYITTYFDRTETGFEVVDGQIVPTPQSSCRLQAQWGWADSVTSGRWSREREVYRLRRIFLPTSVNDDFDYGQDVVITKNKIRGHGRVLSLRFRSSPGRDLHILGWSILLGVAQSV